MISILTSPRSIGSSIIGDVVGIDDGNSLVNTNTLLGKGDDESETGTEAVGGNSSHILMSITTSPRSIGGGGGGVLVAVVTVLLVVLEVELVLEVVMEVVTVVLGTNSPHTPKEHVCKEI